VKHKVLKKQYSSKKFIHSNQARWPGKRVFKTKNNELINRKFYHANHTNFNIATVLFHELPAENVAEGGVMLSE
jgi:hypothetical protein